VSLYDYLGGDNFINKELNELKEEKNNQDNKIIGYSDEILNKLKEGEEEEQDDNSNDNSNDEDNDSSEDNNQDSDRE